MEIYVQLIFVIASAKYCLKAALSNRFPVLTGYAAAAAITALIIYPAVITQPVTIISRMLENRLIVQNMALISTTEAIAGIFISIYLLDNYFRPEAKRRKKAFILKIMPGVLFFCAIGYFELLFFKFRAGHDFAGTAVLFAAILFTGILSVSSLMRLAIRNESLKLEIKLLFNLCILVFGLLISSSVADYNISYAQTDIEWKALAVMALTVIVLIATGIWMQQTDIKKILTKH